MKIKMRPYQQKLRTDCDAAWAAGHKVVLAHLATGGGKTVILGDTIESHQGASCVIAHRSELVSQISLALAALEIAHDVIVPVATRAIISATHLAKYGRSFIREGARCKVASVDTLIRRENLKAWAASVTLWIVDEGHHVVLDNKWHKAIELFTHPNCRGLLPTATPKRADRKGLGRSADGVADVMISGPTARWLIHEGFLTDYDVVCPPSDMKVLADVAASGDWSPKVLKEASKSSKIVGDVVASYQTHAPGRLGVTFTTDVETATDVAKAYNAAGIPAEVLTGETDARLRADVLKRFEARQILQLVVVDIVSEGFDLPAIEVLTMARPTASLATYLQQFGRGLRPVFARGFDLETREGRLSAQAASPKGRRLLLIDHVGNFIRFQGGPDAPREWSLEREQKRGRQENQIESNRICTSATCLRPFKRVLLKCPHCGTPIPPPAGRAGPEQVDGDVHLLDREVLDALREKLPKSAEEYLEELVRSRVPQIGRIAHMNRHKERLAALGDLRAALSLWSGKLHAEGRSDRELHKAIYLRWGMTAIEMLSLNKADAVALTERILGD